MQNPYSHSAAPVAPENQKRVDYETAIGKNVDYYLPKFEEFDRGGSKLGWNWPAFFATTPWFCYRKMWGWGMGNIAWFWGILTFVAPICIGVAAGAAGEANATSAIIKVCIFLGVLLVIPWVALPMFANALYWKRINQVIRNIPPSFKDQPDKRMARIERNGGTGAGAMIGVLVGGAFLFLFIIGILAAIAIPAYQDYTIRGQTVEGLNLAAGPKAAVTEYYLQNQAWPENSEVAGITSDISGNYVESVTVENGSVVIVYGGKANTNITGKTVVLSPGLTEQQDIVWVCANHAPPPNVVTRGPGPYGTDAALKYLPVECR